MRRHRWIRCMAGLFLTGVLAAGSGVCARAEHETKTAVPQMITVVSEAFSDESQMPALEEELRQENGIYRLKSWKLVDTTFPQRQVLASDTIVYEQVEQQDRIPSMAEISVTNENTGTIQKRMVPLKEYDYSDYRWIDGFQLPVTVQNADAEQYAVGELLIPANQEPLFAGCEEELLKAAGLSPASYTIEEVSWVSEPWEEDGVVYREALALGRKQVATVRAVYEGMVKLEEEPAKEIWAEYELEHMEDNTEEWQEEAAQQPVPEQDGQKQGLAGLLLDWLLHYTDMVAVSLLLLLVILCLIALLNRYRHSRDSKTQGRRWGDTS